MEDAELFSDVYQADTVQCELVHLEATVHSSVHVFLIICKTCIWFLHILLVF